MTYQTVLESLMCGPDDDGWKRGDDFAVRHCEYTVGLIDPPGPSHVARSIEVAWRPAA